MRSYVIAANRSSFEKRQRDRNKKAKADLKRAKRLGLAPPDVVDTSPAYEEMPEGEERVDTGPISATELLVRIEQVHRAYDAGDMTLDEFEEAKADLMARLPVD